MQSESRQNAGKTPQTARIVQEQDLGRDAKENEKRESTKESKEKESTSLALSARTREELQLIARSIPSVEQAISFAHSIIGFTDDDFIREWHRQMSMAFWCDEFGNPIRNWGYVFNKWRLNKRLFEKLRDPARIADARTGGAKRKCDNWRGTNPEEVGNVLG